MRLLLTGFGPFGGESINPSAEIVRLIAADPPRGVELTTLILPVRGRITFEQLVPALSAPGVDAWLGVGQAGGRAQLAVERVGINLLIDGERQPADPGTAEDDLAGRIEQSLVEEGPAAYFARLPVAALAAHMSAAGAPAAVSHTAGAYICNEALYVAQHHLATSGRDMPSGFIHVPYLPEQVATKRGAVPSMALEMQTLGVRAAVEFVRDLVAERAAVARSRSAIQPKPGRDAVTENDEVERWFAESALPLEPVTRRVREVILAADPRMTEYVKNRTLTFGYEGDFAAFVQNRDRKRVSLMIHRGAHIPGAFPHVEGEGPTARFMRFEDVPAVDALAGELAAVAAAWCDLQAAGGDERARRARPR